MACRSRIAVVWRSTWSVTFLAVSDGQARAAIGRYLARRCSSASRLSCRPRLVGNSGLVGSPARSFSQVVRVATVPLVSGVTRSLRPLPWQLRCAAGAEVQIAAAEPDQLGGSQPGLDGEQQEGVVAAADPGRLVWGGEQRVDLRLGEVGDQRAV